MSQQTVEESIKSYFEKQDKSFDELFNRLSYIHTAIERNAEEQKNQIRQLMREVLDLKDRGLEKQNIPKSKIKEKMRLLKSKLDNDLDKIFEGKT